MERIAVIVGFIAVSAAFLTANKPAELKNVSEQTSEAVFTASEVATHNGKEDCYAIVSNNVYNLTGWIENHPGGAEAIVGLCGKDGTAQFTSQHGGNVQAQQALAQFFIGTMRN